jgi:subtilase family serine protease
VPTIAKNGASSVAATLANPGTAVAKGAVLRFFDNGAVIGDAGPVDLAPGQQVVMSRTKSVKGTQTLVAVADPGNAIAESNEADNRATTTVVLR